MLPKIDDNNGADVIGPSVSVDNSITRFNGTTGDEIQNSTATINDTGDVVFQTTSDSQSAFTIKDSLGNDIFVAETLPYNLAITTPSAFRIEPFGFGPIPGTGNFIRGMRYRAEIGSGTQANAFRGFDTLLRAAGSASATGTNSFRASNASIAWNSTGTCESMIGMQNFLACGGGSGVTTGLITSMVCNLAKAGFNNNDAGSIGTAELFFAGSPKNIDASHTITNLYGYHCEDQAGTGVTNSWGIKIDDQSSGGYAIRTGTGIHVLGDDVTIGQGAAGQDYTLTFDGESNDGVITWMEDEDYFQIADDTVFDLDVTMSGGTLKQEGISLGTASLYQDRYSANTFAANQFFRKSRGATIDAHTVVNDNDAIGITRYYGSDGSSFSEGAEIVVAVDGTPAAGSVPMEIGFKTKEAGGSLTTKMLIRSDGKVGIGTLVPVSDFEVNGSRGRDITTLAAATLTLGASHDLVAVTYTGTGAVTITLPSATSSWNSTNNIGRSYEIKDAGANASVNNITINRAGADTIITDITGDTSAIINGDGDALIITAISATTWITH